MMSALRQFSQPNGSVDDDPFSFLLSRLISLQSLVDDLQTKSSDTNNTIDFMSHPAPWIVRAKEIKNTKLISPEVQEELNRLERRNNELGTKIADREKTIEEMGMRVEIAEKRFKESREKDSKDKALQDELHALKSEKQANDETISSLRTELLTAQQAAESAESELETLRTATNGKSLSNTVQNSGMTTGTKAIDDHMAAQLTLEANLKQAEILSLQSAVRYLREENRSLRIPISEVLINSAKHSWLDASITNPHKRRTTSATKRSDLERDGLDVWTGLIDVAKNAKPVRLGNRNTSTSGNGPAKKHPPTTRTTRYLVLQQREELEKWEAWRDDFISRAKIASSSSNARAAKSEHQQPRMKTNVGRTGVPRDDGSNLLSMNMSPSTITGVNDTVRKKGGDTDHVNVGGTQNSVGNVRIVES